MRYPKFWTRIVNFLGLASGTLTLAIAFLSVLEAILRYFFKTPTSWTLTVSTYILLYIVFFASPYAFQEGGHVAVDMVKMACDKLDVSGKMRRIISVLGYLFAVVFMAVLIRGVWQLLGKALAVNKYTVSIPLIPMWVLYVPMIVGLVLMLVTLVFMILDCMAKDTDGKYL